MSRAIEELIQRVIEGEASPEECRRLDALIAADPAVRRRRDELEHAFRLLGAARLEPAPEGLRDAVLRKIAAEPAHAGHAPRHGAPSHRTAGPLPWLRLLLPVTAVLAAVSLLWVARTTTLRPGAPVSGTIAGPAPAVSVTVGSGPAALRVDAEAVGGGFRLDVRAGDSPGVAEFQAEGPGATLRRTADAPEPGGTVLRQEFEAGDQWSLHGQATGREVPLRIVVRYRDGREVSADCRVPARRASGPGG